MAANSKRTAPTWQWTARSSQPSRRIGGSRQPGSIGDPVRPPGDDAGCARACLRSARACVPDTCSAQPTTRRHGSVTQLPSGRSGCAGRIVKSGGLIRDIHAALSQLPVSPIIHIMSSNRDSGLPTEAGWILIGSQCGPACARSVGPHTRSDGPRAILASRVHNCAGGTSTCARRPTHRGSVPLTGGPDAGRPPTLMARYRASESAASPRRLRSATTPGENAPAHKPTSRTQSAQRIRTGRCTVS
ncbi:hypothetical protein Br6_02767 [Rhodococcus sp. Br-6]|nr:hypothetical protein Br6_02767 [Rhodococcus sp. Br-6]